MIDPYPPDDSVHVPDLSAECPLSSSRRQYLSAGGRWWRDPFFWHCFLRGRPMRSPATHGSPTSSATRSCTSQQLPGDDGRELLAEVVQPGELARPDSPRPVPGHDRREPPDELPHRRRFVEV